MNPGVGMAPPFGGGQSVTPIQKLLTLPKNMLNATELDQRRADFLELLYQSSGRTTGSTRTFGRSLNSIWPQDFVTLIMKLCATTLFVLLVVLTTTWLSATLMLPLPS
jgi:hypothetical protein